MNQQSTAPVKKNEAVELEIEDLNHEGYGVGRVKGFTLFVPGALPSERVRVQVVKVKKQFGYGKLLELTDASPARVEAPCPFYNACGGCQLQHLSYEAQLQFKQDLVRNHLQRLGGFSGVSVHSTIGMEDPWDYRNKGQFPVGRDQETGGIVTGFYAARSHRIVSVDRCMIQREENDCAVRAVKAWAEKYAIVPYNEAKDAGLLRHVVVKTSFATNEVMVVLVTNDEVLPRVPELVNTLRGQVPGLKSLCQNVNTHITNVIFGSKTRVLWGEPYIYDQIGPLRFAISARSFYQVNPVQTKVLYEKVLEYARLSGRETVIDAYCGIGTISLFLSQKARQVYGVEVVPEAVSDAKRNARLNGIENVTFAVGEAEVVLPRLDAQGVHVDVVVVDPPRQGCEKQLLEAVVKMHPLRLIYVSCNPATLARDLKFLAERGFVAAEVQPVDMFPHTSHIETVVLMSRVEKF